MLYLRHHSLENSWFLLLGFQTSDGTFLSKVEFLIRLNISNKVTTASKRKAEGVHSGKRVERAILQRTTDTIKSEFVQDGLQYLQSLIREVLQQAGLSSNIIKGLAAFDPFILFKRHSGSLTSYTTHSCVDLEWLRQIRLPVEMSSLVSWTTSGPIIHLTLLSPIRRRGI